MEKEGIRLDVPFLKSLSQELDKDIKTLEATILRLQEKFNLASPKQLEISYLKLKLGGPKQKKTKTGQYATGEEILSYLAKDSEIVSAILDWRSLIKLQNTYVEALPLQVDADKAHSYRLYADRGNGPIEFDKSEFAKHPYSYRTGTKNQKSIYCPMKIIL
jgi:DNA polymerase I-like protein with 3'-5' exonuclease and polymerase domains